MITSDERARRQVAAVAAGVKQLFTGLGDYPQGRGDEPTEAWAEAALQSLHPAVRQAAIISETIPETANAQYGAIAAIPRVPALFYNGQPTPTHVLMAMESEQDDNEEPMEEDAPLGVSADTWASCLEAFKGPSTLTAPEPPPRSAPAANMILIRAACGERRIWQVKHRGVWTTLPRALSAALTKYATEPPAFLPPLTQQEMNHCSADDLGARFRSRQQELKGDGSSPFVIAPVEALQELAEIANVQKQLGDTEWEKQAIRTVLLSGRHVIPHKQGERGTTFICENWSSDYWPVVSCDKILDIPNSTFLEVQLVDLRWDEL
eukprot:Sspe_Gene.71953::Locus_42778_Transcript_1_1_Confidence_1.000_Length_1070::g.71953::m.71953